MPASNNYVWTVTEYNALMDRLGSLEYNRDFLALRGAFNYVMDDGSGSTMANSGGLVALTASTSHSYSLPAPDSEVSHLELFNPSAVTHTVSVSGGAGFSSLSLPPRSSIVLASGSDGLTDAKWYVQPNNVTVI